MTDAFSPWPLGAAYKFRSGLAWWKYDGERSSWWEPRWRRDYSFSLLFDEVDADAANQRATYAAGGGCCSARGSPGSMHAQRGALDVQMVIAGLARFGSSKLPTRTKIRCGRASASLNKGVPQVGQNRRCIRLPLSAVLAKSVIFPATLNAAVRKQAPTVPLPAPRYWQSRHQQARVVIGGSWLSQRTAPQRQPPVHVIALSQDQEGK